MRAHVFAPLGMERAGFGVPQGDQPVGHGPGLFRAQVPEDQSPEADNSVVFGPAGTVHLSLEDWLAFTRVFRGRGDGFLAPEALDWLTRVHGPADADYSMGWGILDDDRHGRLFSHAGSNTKWYAQAVVAPDRDFTVLVVTNTGTDGGVEFMRSLTRVALDLIAAAQ